MEWKEPTSEELGRFIREHLLPRITQLEEEVRTLRHVTWPVCQVMQEKWATDQIPEKWKFLNHLDAEETRYLIRQKQAVKPRLSEKGVKLGAGQWGGMREEWDSLVEFSNRPRSVPTHVYDEILKGKLGTPTDATDLRRVSKEGIHLARAIELGVNPDDHASINKSNLG